MERSQSLGDARKEAVKEVHAAQEALELNLGIGPGHGRDGVHLGREGNYATGIDDVPQVLDLGNGQKTLLGVDAEAGIVEAPENLVEVIEMLLSGCTGDQDVVQIDEDALHIAQDPVHQPLKGLGRIFEAKRHSKEFE